MLSLAAWHLMVRARETPRRQWAAFAGCAMLPVACGTAYLVWLSVVGGERSGFLAFSGVTGIDAYQGTPPLVLPRVGIYMRDLFAAQLDMHPYPTQRPEIDKHAFAPLDAEPGGVSIQRLRPAPRRGDP